MLAGKKKTVHVILGLTLGLAFFGCVGVPRRQPLTEGARKPVQQRRLARDKAKAPLQIPEDPKPVAPEEPAPVPEREPEPSPLSSDTRSTAPFQLVKYSTPPPAGTPENQADLRRIYEDCKKKHDTADSYIVRLTRREVLNGKPQPEEVILFRFRKSPRSVHLKWLSANGGGREAVWVEGRYDGKMQTLLAAGDHIFKPAGSRFEISPDSPLVRASSRHSITEAGIGSLIERFGRVLAAQKRGDRSQGTMNYLGQQKRNEFAAPVEALEMNIPAGLEASLPKGGRRWCFVDPSENVPVLIITHDDRGQEVEYYRYDRYLFSVKLDDDDFDPDHLWPKK